MSELRDKRIRFTNCIAEIIDWCNEQEDWEVALGVDYDEADKNEHRRHMSGSLHYLGLANDLCLYIGGEYQTDTEAYRPMGEYWKSLDPDCRWGGDFKKADGNHFALTFGGKS